MKLGIIIDRVECHGHERIVLRADQPGGGKVEVSIWCWSFRASRPRRRAFVTRHPRTSEPVCSVALQNQVSLRFYH